MAIATTLKTYLSGLDVDFDTVAHPVTGSATETAEKSHVSGDRIFKAVLLKKTDDYLLAVLPASHHIRFDLLRKWLGDDVDLAGEDEVGKVFTDCALGAIPPVGYGLDVVLDIGAPIKDDVYFEGGDHATLVRVGASAFAMMMRNARRGHFTHHDA